MKNWTAILTLVTPHMVSGFGFLRRSNTCAVPTLSQSRQAMEQCRTSRKTTTQLFYNPDSDNKNDPSGSDNDFPDSVIWKSLSDTEKWIAQTLDSVNTDNAKSNPFARKEVTYVCDTTSEIPEFVSRVFLRLKEMRELGEAHGKNEVRNALEQGEEYKPHTFRQTLVAVFPSMQMFDSFSVFDDVVNAINRSRRNARDYVGGTNKFDADSWITAVNMAHLHPSYGMDDEEEEDPNEDPKIASYRKQRLRARQSPYPTCVIEVRATPPVPQKEESSSSKRQQKSNKVEGNESSASVTIEELQKLEALFGKSAEAETSLDAEETFYTSIGKLDSIEEVTFITPQSRGQQWIIENIRGYNPQNYVINYSDVSSVDEAYEYVFAHIGMEFHSLTVVDDIHLKKSCYLIMPEFLKKSATSFEKFSKEVECIVKIIPGVSDRLKVSTLHMEHIEKERRSPVPIFVLEWN